MKKIFYESDCLSKEQISDYITDKLNGEALRTVEHHLIDCPFCNDAVEGYSIVNEAPQVYTLESQLKPVTSKVTKRHKLPIYNLNKIAAAILLLVLPAALFFYLNRNAKNQDLFSVYHATYDSSFTTRAASDKNTATSNKELEKAFQYYEAGDFENSIVHFDNYIKEQQQDEEAILYLGLAYLEEAKTSKAIQYLNSLRLNSQSYYEEATWYLALAYTKEQDHQKAKEILEELLKIENGYYHKETNELYQQLK